MDYLNIVRNVFNKQLRSAKRHYKHSLSTDVGPVWTDNTKTMLEHLKTWNQNYMPLCHWNHIGTMKF